LCVQETFLMDTYLSVLSKVSGLETNLVVQGKWKTTCEHICLPIYFYLFHVCVQRSIWKFTFSLFNNVCIFSYIHIYILHTYLQIWIWEVYSEGDWKNNLPLSLME
jgi:hypothetical protein